MYNKEDKYKKIIYILCICISITSCGSENYESYEGQIFEIDYLHTKGFDKNDWIEFDGIRFNHMKNMKDVQNHEKAIPTSVVFKDSLSEDNKFESSFNSLSIAILVGNKLNKLNHQKTSEKAQIVVTDHELLMTLGRLRIHKSDSSSFTIKTSKKYPAEVRILN